MLPLANSLQQAQGAASSSVVEPVETILSPLSKPSFDKLRKRLLHRWLSLSKLSFHNFRNHPFVTAETTTISLQTTAEKQKPQS